MLVPGFSNCSRPTRKANPSPPSASSASSSRSTPRPSFDSCGISRPRASCGRVPAVDFFTPAPAGRPSAARPVCFIGREMWQWSQLYQEILEGVAEVCSANGSPLIFLSAPTLVQVPVTLQPPVFATPHGQKRELQRLLPSVPRGCAGLLFDHLWSDSTLKAASLPQRRDGPAPPWIREKRRSPDAELRRRCGHGRALRRDEEV